MAKDFLPRRDALLLAWSANYAAQLAAIGTAVGITVQQSSDYQALHTTFASDLATATDPSTRTRGAIAGKQASKRSLIAEARELARIINAFPGTTNQQRIDLGLNPRKGEATPINPPTEAPVLEVVSAIGRLLRIKLHAQDSTRRGKPEGVSGATIFSYVGSAPPADINQWTFEGSTTTTTAELTFPASVPAGAQIWLCSFWFNPRTQSGPLCMPVSAYIAGGVVAAEAT